MMKKGEEERIGKKDDKRKAGLARLEKKRL